MKHLEKYITKQTELYKKNFRETGAWWFGFQEAMENVLNYLNERKKKDVEGNRKRRTP